MRIYFTCFNPCALNIGAFYSRQYRRWYVQLIPFFVCMVVVPQQAWSDRLDEELRGVD